MSNTDDFDPAVESILEYACRKVREAQEKDAHEAMQGRMRPRSGNDAIQEHGLPLAGLVVELEKVILQVETLEELPVRAQQLRTIGDLLYSAASHLEAQAGYFPEHPEWH